MKIRLAKKIMACDFRKVVKRNLPWDKELKELDILIKKSHYWYLRHYAYRPLKRIKERRKEGWGKDLFRDHRIAKAISLTKKIAYEKESIGPYRQQGMVRYDSIGRKE